MRNSVALLGLLLFLPCASSGQGCVAIPECTETACHGSPACDGKEVGDNCGSGKSCNPILQCANGQICCGCSPMNQTAQVQCTTSGLNASTLSVLVQAPQFPGLQYLEASTARNLAVSIPSFTLGTTDPVTVIATKIDPNLSGRLALSICGESCRICDPVITLVMRLRGRPETQTFTGLPEEENKIVIETAIQGSTTSLSRSTAPPSERRISMMRRSRPSTSLPRCFLVTRT